MADQPQASFGAIAVTGPHAVASPGRNLWLEALQRLRRDRVAMLGGAFIGSLGLLAILAPLIAPFEYTAIDFNHRLSPPDGAFLLGTDELGRDLLSRLLWGARASLPISLTAMGASTLIGTCIGLLSGYYRGPFDMLAMRCMDILLAFPQLVLALALLAVLGPDIRNLVIALVVSSVPGHARLARGMTLSIGAMQFTESAR